MFHTFETAQYTTPEQTDSNASPVTKRRTSTVRACEPCRRRKIRCNGEYPCETCQWYRKATSCHYTEPRQRQVPSRSRSVEKISHTLQEYRAILQRLFPEAHPEQLKDLPREKLIELVSKSCAFHPPSPRTPSVEEKSPTVDPDAVSLERFQPMPEEHDDEFIHTPDAVKGFTDEVNLLSVCYKQKTSYLGISSIVAVLRVIAWLDPECLAETAEGRAGPSCEASERPGTSAPHPNTVSSSPWDEIRMINAYFTYVHPFLPLIEEQKFRDTYMTAQRTDSRWLLLVNAVLAMGCVAAGTSHDTAHQVYFARAKQHLNIDTLDSPHLETVQAFAILGGVYLQYVQLPNQANSLMGVTLRVATMLGLHRDYSEGVGSAKVQTAASSIEMRRRIWWCAFMVDAWAGYVLGRPSMGRMGHAITAKPPQEPIGESPSLLALVQENVRFCLISTRMEDALAISPLLEEHERHAFDALYIEWYKHSSVQDQPTEPDPNESAGVTVLKNVMRWRYLHHRTILHRPVLLWYAMRKISPDKLSREKKSTIELCRKICADLIHDIATTWRGQGPCQMSGWHAAWLLYQTTMVPLLSLYSDSFDTRVLTSSRQQVETAIQVLKDLQPWSTAARRSSEVITRLYEASKRHAPSPEEPRDGGRPNGMASLAPAASHPPQQSSTGDFGSTYIDVPFANPYGGSRILNPASQEMFMDNMFDGLKWGNGLDSPTGGSQMVHGWDFDPMQNWAGIPQADDGFDLGFSAHLGHLGFDVGTHTHTHTNNPTNHMSGLYGNINMNQRHLSG
ncbi:hypothetical protein A1O3_06840 [Capronia epimyces CBS 606.96]|uniref:Zn(2)-C6 fungal-type domain-containing protein n=1 Tax=Capronia epimyces CBS 606.96 TaxID=1182542 RepID=W9XS23_9EURO|nr:uncharacterized protein A1O3_06840 [Capronia epimyces CBS 606.96]EXJ83023.1 hypothetical protein A1O3_06840 [Capronia epimyces CBS 606.96]